MKKERIRDWSRWIMAIMALSGPCIQIVKYGIGMMTYYTNLSNFLVAGMAIYMVIRRARGGDMQSTIFLRVKGAVTMSIMITFVIYHFMLSRFTDDFWRVENIICHYITPLYFFLDTLIWDRPRAYRWSDAFAWTSLPLAYLAFALVNGYLLHIPIPDGKDGYFAYYFLNAPKYGWNYVLTSIIAIFMAYVLAGYVWIAIKSIRLSSSDVMEELTELTHEVEMD